MLPARADLLALRARGDIQARPRRGRAHGRIEALALQAHGHLGVRPRTVSARTVALTRPAAAPARPIARRLAVALGMIAAMAAISCGGATACGQVANPDGWAAGVVVDGVVYTGTMDGTLLALDADTGQSMWEFTALVGEKRRHAFYGDPVVVGDAIYAAGYDGHLYAVSRADGSKLWDVPVGEQRESLVGGPAHEDGILVVASVRQVGLRLRGRQRDRACGGSTPGRWSGPRRSPRAAWCTSARSTSTSTPCP